MACSCGCSNKNSCSCESGFSSEGIQRAEFEAATYPGYKEATGARGCVSNKGKFFDLTLEDFIVPEVGREAYLKVCDGSLWKAKQYIGVFYGSNFAAFKITEVGTGSLKVLNGCDRSGDNPFIGNPDKGTNIPAKSILCAIPPTGCSSDLTLRIVDVLTTRGAPAILDILANSEEICFTSAPAVAEDEEVHIFGGTKPDCDCAPDASVSSCLRKIIKIFTGQGGRTLCMPEVATINLASAEERRVAVFDENDCVKKGPTYSDLKSCENADPHAKDVVFDAVNGCLDGVSIGLTPSDKYMELTTIEVDDPDSEDEDDKIIRWVATEKRYAVLQNKVGSGISGGPTVSGAWTKKTINTVVQESTGLISLTDSEFVINKPGLYKIDWSDCFYRCRNNQTRLENVNDSAEVYYSLSGYSSTDQTDFTTIQGSAIIKIEQGTTKRFKIMYRAETAIADGLGEPNGWGPNVYSNISIVSL